VELLYDQEIGKATEHPQSCRSSGILAMTQTITLPQIDNQSQKQDQQAPLYNVVLLNDDDHSYDYVIEMLQRIFCFSVQQAYQHALEVDLTQRTILLTCGLEEAEFGRDQILSYGPDPRIPNCKGSMSAIVEPVAG
jgi:ATP-dependent Clp protease adaptor protein ClpS